MKRQEFTNAVTELIQNYIENFFDYDKNPMLRVNPESLLVEIENGYAFQEDLGYSDEVIENAAFAEGDATESAEDNQAKQNFEYYPVGNFLNHEGDKTVPDKYAIEELADRYIPSPLPND